MSCHNASSVDVGEDQFHSHWPLVAGKHDSLQSSSICGGPCTIRLETEVEIRPDPWTERNMNSEKSFRKGWTNVCLLTPLVTKMLMVR